MFGEDLVADPQEPAHWSFWIIGAIALTWNLLGCINFFLQMDPEMIAHYRPSEQAIIAARPLWATAGFAAGVFGGAIGSLLLLLRSRFAFHLFVLSLLGVIGATVHTLGAGVSFNEGEVLGIIVAPIGFAAFLVWYARRARVKAWLPLRG